MKSIKRAATTLCLAAMVACPFAAVAEAVLLLREATDPGDVAALPDISEELTCRSGAFSPYKSKIAQLPDDFDFDGILELVNDLD
jgi:two-component system, sensor histidine kinase and response regulator